mgnify:CR=1 FL=1
MMRRDMFWLLAWWKRWPKITLLMTNAFAASSKQKTGLGISQGL